MSMQLGQLPLEKLCGQQARAAQTLICTLPEQCRDSPMLCARMTTGGRPGPTKRSRSRLTCGEGASEAEHWRPASWCVVGRFAHELKHVGQHEPGGRGRAHMADHAAGSQQAQQLQQYG